MLRAAVVVFLLLAVSFTVVFSYFYIKYDRIIEKRFRTPVFANSAKIYALPRTVSDGEKITAKEIAAELRQAGYSEQEGASKLGSFELVKGGIEITPGDGVLSLRLSRRGLRLRTARFRGSPATGMNSLPMNWSRSWSRPCSTRSSARSGRWSSTTTFLR